MKTRTYIIETIEANGVWYPIINRVKVEAKCLEDALFEVANNNVSFDFDDVERTKEECAENFGMSKRGNEFLALVYNQIIDARDYYGTKCRILRGWIGKRKCFDITIKQY